MHLRHATLSHAANSRACLAGKCSPTLHQLLWFAFLFHNSEHTFIEISAENSLPVEDTRAHFDTLSHKVADKYKQGKAQFFIHMNRLCFSPLQKPLQVAEGEEGQLSSHAPLCQNQ